MIIDPNSHPPKSGHKFCSPVIAMNVESRRKAQTPEQTKIALNNKLNLRQNLISQTWREIDRSGHETIIPRADCTRVCRI
jgi:hypothetical protein